MLDFQHWDFLLYLLLGALMGGIKGRHEKREVLTATRRLLIALGVLVLMLACSLYKFPVCDLQTGLQAGVNLLAGFAAVWIAFSWARWFFGPVRWN